jgi:DNA topoisomerase II
MKEKTIE